MKKATEGIRAIDLPASLVRPGSSEVRIRITPPEGHAFNPSAPFELRVRSHGTAVDLDPQAVELVSPRPLMPHAIPARFHAGEDRIEIDVVAYSCDQPESRVCYYQVVRLHVPVRVEEIATDVRIDVDWRLDLPDATVP